MDSFAPGNGVALSYAIRGALRKHPFVFALAAAALVRLIFIAHAQLSFESDEAIVGLMARHILYEGEFPLFYYGQSYLGPLEPASAAVSFAIFGPSVTALRLAPAVYSLVFIFFTARFARRAYGLAAAVACLCYLAIPPLFLLTWSVKARGGYSELIALGAVFLSLVLDVSKEKKASPWKWLALGATAGLAAWTDPLAVVYVAPAAFYLVLRFGRRIIDWETLGAIAAFAITAGPMLAANLRSHGETLRELTGPNVSQAMSITAYRHNLSAVLRDSVPTLLGFFQASSNLPAFAAARAQTPWPGFAVSALEIALVAGAGGLAIASLWHAVKGRPEPGDLLVWVGAATVLTFCTSRVEVLYLTEPRYLLPLYALLPVAGAFWAKLRSVRPRVAVGLLAAVLAFNVVSVVQFEPSLAAPRLDGKIVDAGNISLAAFLEAKHVRAIYADYWLAYPVAFQSREQVIPSVIDDNLRVGFNRYIPYAISVDRAGDPSVLVVAGSPAEERLETALKVSGGTYHIDRWRNLDLFEQVVPPFRPSRA